MSLGCATSDRTPWPAHPRLAQNMRNQLSKWLREQTVVFPDYGKAAGSLTTFFRANAGRAREPAAQASVEMGCRPVPSAPTHAHHHT